MARNHVRWQFGVWRKPEHRETSKDARLLYMTICGDEALNQAGVVVPRVTVWAEDAGMTDDEVEAALEELSERRFISVDWRTLELLVRTFIRNDGVADQPNVLRSALNVARHVRSDRLRHVLACELRKLPAKSSDKELSSGKKFSYPDPHAVADEIDPGEPPTDPDEDQDPKGSREPFGQGIGERHGAVEVDGERSSGSSRSLQDSSSSRDDGATPGTTPSMLDPTDEPEPKQIGFDEFWSHWPRKTGKGEAKKKFNAAVRRGAKPAHIVAAAERQVAQWKREQKEVRYIPHATTWLNQDRYQDPVEKPELRLVSGDSPWGGVYGGSENPWAAGMGWR